MLRSVNLLNTTIKRVIGTRHSSSVAIREIPKKWTTLSSAEQNTLAKELEELQKGDWNQLAKDDKLACYYVAFGPHGPREPIHKEGNTARVFGGVGAVLTMSYIIFYLARKNGKLKTTNRLTGFIGRFILMYISVL
ncbi:unnamed protein product [Absidia cylindrospora]